jgi:hypothetical protein
MLLLNLKPPYKDPGDAHIDESEPTSIQETGAAHDECMTIVKEQVCVQANVKIIPKVMVGRISTFCGDVKIGKCELPACSRETCEFTVSRKLCVQIPLEFSAETFVRPAGHVCGDPELEPCHRCES